MAKTKPIKTQVTNKVVEYLVVTKEATEKTTKVYPKLTIPEKVVYNAELSVIKSLIKQYLNRLGLKAIVPGSDIQSLDIIFENPANWADITKAKNTDMVIEVYKRVDKVSVQPVYEGEP